MTHRFFIFFIGVDAATLLQPNAPREVLIMSAISLIVVSLAA